MQLGKLLRYKISDLRQLNVCKSNNSQALTLVTTTFINDNRLNGLRVQVVHDTFGVLYAYTFDAKGTLISPYEAFDEINIAELIRELKKYGFLIDYDPIKAISQEQIEFLRTLDKLGFDKIRKITVVEDRNKDTGKSIVVLFNIDKNPDWINNLYCTTQTELNTAFNNGSAFNVSELKQAKKFDWSWLAGFVADVGDVIRDNTYCLERKPC